MIKMNKTKIFALGATLALLFVTLAPMTTALTPPTTLSTQEKNRPFKKVLVTIKNVVTNIVNKIFPTITANDNADDDKDEDKDEPDDDPSTTEDGSRTSYDLNGDGLIDSKDVELLKAFYGQEAPHLDIISNPDLDESGLVDLADLAEVLSCCGPCDAGAPADFNGDLLINDCDICILKAFYGQSCDLSQVQTPDLTGDDRVDIADLAELLAYIE